MTQHNRIAQILKEHPHYGAVTIGAMMGISAGHVRVVCTRNKLVLLDRNALEEILDKKGTKRGKKV